MEKINIYYTILRYIPYVTNMKSIVVGIAVHCPSLKYAHFFKTISIEKVKSFDNNYNSDFFDMVVSALAYEINYPNLNVDNRFDNINDINFLKSKTSYLTNEFRFDTIQIFKSKNPKDDISKLKTTLES